MLQSVSGDSPADYLSMMTAVGYSVHLIDKQRGIQEQVDPTKLLAEWGDLGRIEDLAFIIPPLQSLSGH
jgi:hypothetical protein